MAPPSMSPGSQHYWSTASIKSTLDLDDLAYQELWDRIKAAIERTGFHELSVRAGRRHEFERARRQVVKAVLTESTALAHLAVTEESPLEPAQERAIGVLIMRAKSATARQEQRRSRLDAGPGTVIKSMDEGQSSSMGQRQHTNIKRGENEEDVADNFGAEHDSGEDREEDEDGYEPLKKRRRLGGARERNTQYPPPSRPRSPPTAEDPATPRAAFDDLLQMLDEAKRAHPKLFERPSTALLPGCRSASILNCDERSSPNGDGGASQIDGLLSPADSRACSNATTVATPTIESEGLKNRRLHNLELVEKLCEVLEVVQEASEVSDELHSSVCEAAGLEQFLSGGKLLERTLAAANRSKDRQSDLPTS